MNLIDDVWYAINVSIFTTDAIMITENSFDSISNSYQYSFI